MHEAFALMAAAAPEEPLKVQLSARSTSEAGAAMTEVAASATAAIEVRKLTMMLWLNR